MNENQVSDQAYSSIRGWSMTMGILMMLLGVFTIVFSVATTFVTIFLLGAVLAVRGLLEGVYALFTMRQEWFWRRLAGGILSLVIGVLLLSRPQLSAAAFTLFVAAFLIAHGLFKTIVAPFSHAPVWGWDMAGGVLSFVLGLWVWSGWPVNALWFIGMLIGVEILTQGMIITTLPFAAAAGKPTGQGTPGTYAR